jgi:hypothetical protein
MAQTVGWGDGVIDGSEDELTEAEADSDRLPDKEAVTDFEGEIVAEIDLLDDRLELEVTDRVADGELEITGPAPTATNAMFVD